MAEICVLLIQELLAHVLRGLQAYFIYNKQKYLSLRLLLQMVLISYIFDLTA